MNIGLKIVPQTDPASIDSIIDEVDFVELYAKIGHDYGFVKRLGKPVTIHAPHSGDNVNLADSAKEENNTAALNWARGLADEFAAEVIVIHPAYSDSDTCSIANTTNIIKANYDERYCIESMPHRYPETDGVDFYGSTVDELARIAAEADIGVCLDFNHSATAAHVLGREPREFLQEFLDLKPRHFHIADAKYGNTKFEHFNLFDGDLDKELIRSLIPSGANITLETPPDREKQLREVEFLRRG